MSREARFTVVPKTSPIRVVTVPNAIPTRSSGMVSSFAMVSMSRMAISAATPASSAEYRTSSPSVLMSRPPRAATRSAAVVSKASTSSPSSSSSIRRVSRVNPTRSAKPTASRRSTISSSSAACTTRPVAAASWRRQT